MSSFNIHQIKRQARKEAWYGDSWNPWRKNMGGPQRSATSPLPDTQSRSIDVENGRPPGGEGFFAEDETPLSPLATFQSEPSPRSRGYSEQDKDTIGRHSKEEFEMTPAGMSNLDGKSREGDSEETTVDRVPARPRSEEEKARRRFLARFRKPKDKDNLSGREGDDAPKTQKRPWYKGKVLKHKPFTVTNQLRATILSSWVNILLLAAPVGIALNYAHVDGKIVFVVNFIAIIPLAGMLSFATEEISLHVGESLGGLLNASFGNAVEMIVAIIALAKNEVVVVQTSLIGSILSNLLLVMGMCFFFGGLRRKEQFFNQTVAQTAASLLALAVGSVIIPTCFDLFSTTSIVPIAALSRGTAVILLFVYCGYLFFQLHTHEDMFAEESQKVAMKPRKNAIPNGAIAKGLAKAGGIGAGAGRPYLPERPPYDELIRADAYEAAEDEPEEPQLHIAVAWATLAGATAIIGLCAEFMVDGISSITASGKVSVEFVGLILLPIVGNAAEHATAVTVACKDKMDLAIGVAVGSSMQVSLFLIPLMVVIGWIMGNDNMTLDFDGFQVAVLFVAVLLVNYLIGDGKSNWLEGLLLQCLYLIIAVCSWYYHPQASTGASGGTNSGNATQTT